jgi:hypothetical protein
MSAPLQESFASEADLQEALNERRVTAAWKDFLTEQHWQVFFRGSFAEPVSDGYAQRAGVEYIASLGPEAYSAVFWGEGIIGGRFHIHALIGGLWNGRLSERYLDLNHRRLRRHWERRHGSSDVTLFDPRKGGIAYLTSHHEIEIVGRPRKYRARCRGERNRSTHIQLQGSVKIPGAFASHRTTS